MTFSGHKCVDDKDNLFEFCKDRMKYLISVALEIESKPSAPFQPRVFQSGVVFVIEPVSN